MQIRVTTGVPFVEMEDVTDDTTESVLSSLFDWETSFDWETQHIEETPKVLPPNIGNTFICNREKSVRQFLQQFFHMYDSQTNRSPLLEVYAAHSQFSVIADTSKRS